MNTFKSFYEFIFWYPLGDRPAIFPYFEFSPLNPVPDLIVILAVFIGLVSITMTTTFMFKAVLKKDNFHL